MIYNNKLILIVEDEIEVANSMKKSLEHSGFQVLDPVIAGEEAVKIAEQNKPDLILMDILLSGPMDGLEAGKWIRQHLDIPIIYMTGFTDKAEAIRESGRIPLLKPFTMKDLLAAIDFMFYAR